jgi:hypothetical protein
MPKPVTTTLLPIKNKTPLEQALLGGAKKKPHYSNRNGFSK